MQIKLTANEGDISLNNNGSGIIGTTYRPMVGAGETVNESFTIALESTPSAMRSAKDTIEQWLFRAKQQQKKPSHDRIFVQARLDSTLDWERSEILDGQVEWVKPGMIGNGGQVELAVRWTRRNFWEGPEAQLPLSNSNGTNITAALNVYNGNDHTGTSPSVLDNAVEIAAGLVAGGLPAACRIEMTNRSTGPIAWMWIGQNWIDPANYVNLLEAESAVGVTGVSEASNSGGQYVSISLASGNEVDLLRWTLPAATLNAARGQQMRAMLRFFLTSSMAQHVRFRFQIRWNTATFWEGQQVQPSDSFHTLVRDIGTLRLSPGLDGLTSLDAVDLVLTGQQETGSAITLYLDCLYLIPLDGWRWMYTAGYGVPQNSRLVDDGIDGFLYRDDGAGGGKVAMFTGFGAPILLKPGARQRLYFLFHEVELDGSDKTHSVGVKVFYRPRRLAL